MHEVWWRPGESRSTVGDDAPGMLHFVVVRDKTPISPNFLIEYVQFEGPYDSITLILTDSKRMIDRWS